MQPALWNVYLSSVTHKHLLVCAHSCRCLFYRHTPVCSLRSDAWKLKRSLPEICGMGVRAYVIRIKEGLAKSTNCLWHISHSKASKPQETSHHNMLQLKCYSECCCYVSFTVLRAFIRLRETISFQDKYWSFLYPLVTNMPHSSA